MCLTLIFQSEVKNGEVIIVASQVKIYSYYRLAITVGFPVGLPV
jgi:hypothetical protein